MLFVDRGRRPDPARGIGRGRDLGQPEIQHLGVPALGHENIRGLDVAMHDALRMRRIQPIGNLDGQREHGLVIQ